MFWFLQVFEYINSSCSSSSAWSFLPYLNCCIDLCILRLYSTPKVAAFWRWMKQAITAFSVLKCSETLWEKVLYICTRGIISRQQLCQMLNWDWSLTAELLTSGNRSLNCKCWPNLTSGGANGNNEKLCSFTSSPKTNQTF